MRDTFVRALIEEAKENRNIELLTGDLGFGVLKPFWEALPNQFTNVGIAEQNMTSMAAGMALEGRTVFTYSIGNFPTLRCLEQIRNDCAYHNANVKIVCVGGGLVYGSLGMSHQATEDIAVMRVLPDVKVFAPGDLVEAEAVTRAMTHTPGTCYLRLGRGGEKRIHEKVEGFEIGKAVRVRNEEGRNDKQKVAVFSTGAILDEVTAACDGLERDGYGIIQYSFPTVKPIDEAVIEECSKHCDYIVTVEEHNVVGGFGGAVAEVVSKYGGKAKLARIGLIDLYCVEVGNQKYLRNQYGIDSMSIIDKIKGLE